MSRRERPLRSGAPGQPRASDRQSRTGRGLLTLCTLGVLGALGVGCLTAAAQRGTGLAAAERALRAVVGLAGEVRPGSWTEGFRAERSLSVTVRVLPGHRIRDGDALARWLLELGWCVREHRPTRWLTLEIDPGPPAQGGPWVAREALAALGVRAERTLPGEGQRLFLPVAHIEALLGTGPLRCPSAPETMLLGPP